MVVEVVAIIVCSAASSYATYELVTRHLSVYFDKVQQDTDQLSKDFKRYASALDASSKARFEDLKQTHVETIAKHVALEVKNTPGCSAAKTCDFCGGIVARFEKLEDKIRCVNCTNEGR